MSDILQHRQTGPIATLTLNAPGSLNALSDAMLAALRDALSEIGSGDARVVVLRAEGRAFCAGHDLREMQAMRQAEDGGAAAFADLFDRCAAVMAQIRNLPQPVIARVHGLATAAGCQLVATCDLAVAAADARFGVNGVDIGLFCSTPMVALTRNVGRKRAFEMLSMGRFLSAEEAVQAGLVNRAVPSDALDECIDDYATHLAKKLPGAVRVGKSIFHAQAEMPVEDAYRLARDAMVANLSDDDTAEGIQAFLEKRAPRWTQ
ncbi:enoyl-CoA hydratase [Jannaschia sp. S6380]|uniref:enoyl-CoA hydratase n=1 Tax=Jannaschia sp. S6380 TaxID=2926408 RepID=UPI001FF56A2E|nr:enoyl-CoA hydratase [Jannaschia sp. S6380]MCK0166944.1 enoyl-CoA hydratase [Jannaschia sp. S6380]